MYMSYEKLGNKKNQKIVCQKTKNSQYGEQKKRINIKQIKKSNQTNQRK